MVFEFQKATVLKIPKAGGKGPGVVVTGGWWSRTAKSERESWRTSKHDAMIRNHGRKDKCSERNIYIYDEVWHHG